MARPSRPPRADSLFRDRNFFALWLVSISHNRRKLIFVVLVALGIFNHSNTQVSAISLAFALPAILFGSMVGVFADRFSLRLWSPAARPRPAHPHDPAGGAAPGLWPLLGFAFASASSPLLRSPS
jgi:hypothetical protein